MDCSPPRLLCPWDSLGKNTGVGGHALLKWKTRSQQRKMGRNSKRCRSRTEAKAGERSLTIRCSSSFLSTAQRRVRSASRVNIRHREDSPGDLMAHGSLSSLKAALAGTSGAEWNGVHIWGPRWPAELVALWWLWWSVRGAGRRWLAAVRMVVRRWESVGDGHVSDARSGAGWHWWWEAENSLQKSQISIYTYIESVSPFCNWYTILMVSELGHSDCSNHVCPLHKLELHC